MRRLSMVLACILTAGIISPTHSYAINPTYKNPRTKGCTSSLDASKMTSALQILVDSNRMPDVVMLRSYSFAPGSLIKTLSLLGLTMP